MIYEDKIYHVPQRDIEIMDRVAEAIRSHPV